MAKILAIDDSVQILKLIKNALEINHHIVDIIENPISVSLEKFQQYDLILLDVMMPDIDGFTLCQEIRSNVYCPIVFLTAKTDEASIVQGLIRGGDDYITKPFGVMELNARVEAHLRRESREKEQKRLILGNIVFDFDKRNVEVNSKPLELTKTEYKICEFLVLNRGKVFSKEHIYEYIYTMDSDVLLSTITEYIRAIRKKFKIVDYYPIETVWGVGYLWK